MSQAAPGYVLYGARGSGSAAVEMALVQAGQSFRKVNAASWEDNAGRDELARVNPLQQIPTLVLPDGSQKVVKTGLDGRTEAFAARGQVGAWARHWEEAAGERDGRPYTQVRHYGMLTFDSRAVATATATAGATPVRAFAHRLPEATSSFGAAALDGWLYVYGGHVVRTHAYSTDSMSGRFSRIRAIPSATA